MVPMTFPYGEQMNNYTTLNQGQIEALAIRYGMNDILWDLAESEQGFNVSITAEYMSQFDCCSEPSMNVQDLVTLLNYTFEAVHNDSLKRDESYFKNPSVFFNNDRFYDFVPLMPAMMELYYYESEQIGWF